MQGTEEIDRGRADTYSMTPFLMLEIMHVRGWKKRERKFGER